MQVYLDNAATTRLDERVLEAMMPYLRENFGNASSPHGLGRKARFAVEDARERIAAHIGAEPGEIVFTSGGTEANNLAVWSGTQTGEQRLITSSAEHESVLEPARELASRGGSLILVDPLPDGSMPLDEVRRNIENAESGRGLISAMHTNNETGTLNSIAEFSELCRKSGWLLHSDAVQALGWADLNVDDLGVDLMSISAHKVYGPKGVGALFVRGDTVDLQPFIRGGSQERRRRGGTENVAGIVGFAKAVDLAADRGSDYGDQLESLKSRLLNRLAPILQDGVVMVNTPKESAPHLLNLSFPPGENGPVDGEMLLLNLDLAGISVSSGSACTSGALEPSHVLLAMGRDRDTAAATVRFSLGRDNTPEEVDFAADELMKIVDRMAARRA